MDLDNQKSSLKYLKIIPIENLAVKIKCVWDIRTAT
jgi:hypothetical protein